MTMGLILNEVTPQSIIMYIMEELSFHTNQKTVVTLAICMTTQLNPVIQFILRKMLPMIKSNDFDNMIAVITKVTSK